MIDAVTGEPVPRRLWRERPITGDRAHSDTMALIGACRDVLRVIRAELDAQPNKFKPALDR